MATWTRRLALGGMVMAWTMARAPAFAEDYVLDSSHAHVVFKVSHLGYATTIGQFGKIEGKVHVDWNNPAGARVEVTIDAASIDSNWPARDEHLRNADFFHVAKYPTIRFVSTGIDVTGEDTAMIEGDLTLLGQSRPVTLDTVLNKRAPFPGNNKEHFGVSAVTVISRSDFGMTYAVPMIPDEVEIQIEAEFNIVE